MCTCTWTSIWRGFGFDPNLKTIVLWIYNINQNGSANVFREELSRYFARDMDGNVRVRDMTPELLAEFLFNISTAQKIRLPDLGIRLVLQL